MLRPALIFPLLLCLIACAPAPTHDEPLQEETAAIPRIGIVGLVQEQRKREINRDNWQTAIAGVIRNSERDHHVNVVSRRYEVTVFYGAGEQAVVVVDEDPGLQPGQRVRVTGRHIEALH
jgi:hypothetical protein